MENKIQLKGSYRLNDDYLINDTNKLKVGMRHRPKKGQAKRYITAVHKDQPVEHEHMQYISSLYAVQGSKNIYTFDYDNQRYALSLTGLNEAVIKPEVKQPALTYAGSEKGDR